MEALENCGLQIPEFHSDVSFKLVNGSLVPCEPRKNRCGSCDDAIEINPIVWQKRLEIN